MNSQLTAANLRKNKYHIEKCIDKLHHLKKTNEAPSLLTVRRSITVIINEICLSRRTWFLLCSGV